MITLTSDFGSPYPAAMKGVMLRQTDAQLVDIAHDLPRQDPRAAAFWLRETVPYFPPAVHLAVVDPGVGTDRRAITIRVGDHALVGPDNGLLRPVVRRLRESVPADDPSVGAFEIVVDDPVRNAVVLIVCQLSLGDGDLAETLVVVAARKPGQAAASGFDSGGVSSIAGIISGSVAALIVAAVVVWEG